MVDDTALASACQRRSHSAHAVPVNDVGDSGGIFAVADRRQQSLVWFVGGRVVCAQDERAETAVVRRCHHLHHLDAVRVDSELLIALEHVANRVAFDDEHGAEGWLKQLRLLPDLLEHRVRPQFQEEADDCADSATLSRRLNLEGLQLLQFSRRDLALARFARELLESRDRDRVVRRDPLDRCEERLESGRRFAGEERDIWRTRIKGRRGSSRGCPPVCRRGRKWRGAWRYLSQQECAHSHWPFLLKQVQCLSAIDEIERRTEMRAPRK